MTDRIHYHKHEPPGDPGRLISYTRPTPKPEPLIRYQPQDLSARPDPNLIVPQRLARKPDYYTLSLVAPSESFSHERASEKLEAIWSLGDPVIASWAATAVNLETTVTCRTGSELALQSTLYGVNPDLDITLRPTTTERRQLPTLVSISGERHEDLEALPMKDIAQQGKHDPINRILEACYPLEAEERVDLHFFLKPALNERLERAYRSSYSEGSFLGIFRWKELKFNPRVYDEVIERMRQYAFDVVSVVALSGRSPDRLSQRAHALAAAFASRTTNTGSKIRHFAQGIVHDDWQYRSSFSLNDLNLADRYGTLMTVSELANLWHLPSEQVRLASVTHLKLPPVPLPPRMISATGVPLGTHHYRGQARPIRIPLPDLKAGPEIILGRTGQGKTTLGHQVLASIVQLESGLSLCLIDPHGDWARDFALRSIPETLLARTYFIDFADTAHPIGFPFFQHPAGLSQDAFVADTFESIKLLFRESWSSTRMETVVHNTVAVLCQMPDATLLDIPRLYNDPLFRRQALTKISDPAVRTFFDYYEGRSEAARQELTAPVMSRINALFRSAPIRNITCRSDGLDIPALLNEGALLLFSFAGPEIAAEADLLMELLVAKVNLAMKARAGQQPQARRYTVMAIDESQRVKGPSLPALISEGRKFGISLVLLTQFLANWTPQVEQAVTGNSASLLTFALGPDDARKLAPVLAPYTAQQIMDLDRHQALAKINVHGISSPAFPLATQPVVSEPRPEHLEIARENARQRFGQPRAEVERRYQSTSRPAPTRAADWGIFDVDAAT